MGTLREIEGWKFKNGRIVPVDKLTDLELTNILKMLKKAALGKWMFMTGILMGADSPPEEHVNEHAESTWEDYAPEIMYDLLEEAASRNLHWDDGAVNLNMRPKLERYLVGALRDCIKAHGPITNETAPSAAKRIIGAIKAFNKGK